MKNRPFAPGLLKKLDEKWMKKYPLLWSSRIHLVFYYGGLLLIPVLLFAFLAYFPPLSEQSPWTGNLLISIISLISIVIWLIYLVRFNPYKRYYIEKRFSFLRTFLLYLFILMFFVSWIFIPQYVGYAGTKMRFSKAQIEEDIRLLNHSIAGEAYYKAPEYFTLIGDTVAISKLDSVEYSYSDPNTITNTITYSDRVDGLVSKYDSIAKINDTVFAVLTYPNFNFIRLEDDLYNNSKTNKIFKYNGFKKDPETYEEYHNTINRIASKYLGLGRVEHRYYYDYYDKYDSSNKFGKIETEYRDKYDLKAISSNAQALEQKLSFSFNLEIYFRVVYYIAICLTMLLFMFRHSNAKAFFLSLLSTFILFLITLVMMFAFKMDFEEDIATLLIVYSGICLAIGLTIFIDKRKSLAKMIALNMFYMGTIFIPMLIAYKLDKDWLKENYTSVEVFTFIAMLILMIFMYRPLYQRWYTLPDE
jgi:hypothetical protein